MERSLGRGQRLKAVMKDNHAKRSDKLQDELQKNLSYEYTNESIEKFCRELERNDAESPYACESSKRIDHSSGVHETGEKVTRSYQEEYPALGSQTFRGARRRRNVIHCASNVAQESCQPNNFTQNHVPVPTTSSFTGDVTAPISQYPQKVGPNIIPKGIGRGQRLKMVAESISLPRATFSSDIEKACGTDYTNQSIEHFVAQLIEKNENMEKF